MERPQKTLDEQNENSFEEFYKQLPKDTRLGPELVCHQGFWYSGHLFRTILSFQAHFEAQPTDIFITGMPKTGNTWLKSLVFATSHRHHQPISESPLLHHNPHEFIPFMEFGLGKAQMLEASPTRMLATHLPYEALPQSMKDSDCKIIYICRNPLDTFISSWFFYIKGIFEKEDSPREGRPLPSMEEYFELYLQGVIPFGPFFDHVLGYWKMSTKMPQKVLFLKYEELMENTTIQLKRIAEFIGHPFSQEEEQGGVIEEIVRLCSIKNLKDLKVNKEGQNNFFNYQKLFRKGEVGDWANYISSSMVDRMRKLMHQKFEGVGLIMKG